MAAGAVIKGDMTLGMMTAMQYIIGQLNAPISQFISFVQEAQDAKISLERLGEIHDKKMRRKRVGITSVIYLKMQISNLRMSFSI